MKCLTNPCRRSYDLDVNATHKYLDLLRTSDYITEAGLQIATSGNYTGKKGAANPWDTSSDASWYDMATNYSSHPSDSGNLSSGTNLVSLNLLVQIFFHLGVYRRSWWR